MYTYFFFFALFSVNVLFGQMEPGSPAPDITEDNKFLSEFFYMLFMLGLLIGAMLLASWFLKRMASARYEALNTSSNIRVVERRAISPKTTLYLIESEGRSVLLAETPNALVSLLNQELEKELE